MFVPPPPTIPPVADAGPDQEVVVDETAQLDGSGSSDPDGGSLTFSWQLTTPFGSSAFLPNPSLENPTFVPDVAGDYVAQLVVNDGTVDSDPDQVTIAAKVCDGSAIGSGELVERGRECERFSGEQ